MSSGVSLWRRCYNLFKMIKRRYRKILSFFAGILIGLILWEVILPRLGFKKKTQLNREKRLQKAAVEYHDLAVSMGGVLIKVGQWLSARLDVMPPAITQELMGLQDEVPAENFQDVRQVIEAEFDAPLEEYFSEFSPEPIASASIGQVHTARIRKRTADEDAIEDQPVVVKVQRPDIELLVATDLAALRVVGRWLEWYRPIRRRVNVQLLIKEFSTTLYEEIDYLHEGKNAQTFKENFADTPDVIVPQVHWSHTTRRVLTLDDVRAIKITDYAGIEAAGIDRQQVAKRLFDVYLKQVFEHRFFHADPHPGNLFVAPGEPGDDGAVPFALVFVDFGMAGRVMPNVVTGLQELIFAVVARDADRVIKAYQLLDVLLPGADLDRVRAVNERGFERFWGLTTPELMELGQAEALVFLDEFRDLIYNNPFQLPENLILLGRALAILNGMCTGLDENFNVWHSVIPWAEKLMKQAGRGSWKVWAGETVDVVRILASLPRRTESILTRLEQGRLEMRNPDLSHQVQRVSRSMRSLASAVFFAAFLFGGIQLYLAGEITLAVVLGAGAGITLLVAAMPGKRLN